MNFDLSREWLETNGLGSFASGTVVNANTRRYHALLCLAALPPQNRLVLVNKLDEALTLGVGEQARCFELGANVWPGVVNPHGYKYLQGFAMDPLPTWTFEIPAEETGAEPLILEKTLWMPHEAQATVVSYRLLRGAEGNLCTLSARAFLTGRDFHSLHHANAGFNTHAEATLKPSSIGTSTCTFICSVRMQPYTSLPPVVFTFDGNFEPAGDWYKGFQYPVEQERGLDFSEDAWCPGQFEWRLSRDTPDATIVVGTEEASIEDARSSRGREIGRRRALSQILAPQVLEPASAEHDQAQAPAEAPAEAPTEAETRALSQAQGKAQEQAREQQAQRETDGDVLARLARAADQFIVRRRDGLHTILAGYPWFGDWGRDTMIALPGLCLSTGRSGEALSILLAFSQAMSRGMIPNRFPDEGEVPDYNTIDATLWFFHAVGRYLAANPDDCAAMQTLYPALRDSLEWHWKGTRYNIKADEEDGLLAGGDARTQLTWMDAKIGDTAFTPRSGKAVEIQALWFNALCTGARLAELMDDAPFAARCAQWSRKAKSNFARLFWNEQAGCLFDVLNGTEVNAQIRPNQIFALSLPERLLPLDKEKKILRVVERELLTPRGLRSLSPNDPQFRGVYEGGQWSRDSAYHQGTVWAWPIGAYCSAFLRVHKRSPRARTLVRAWLQPLIEHLDEAGLGTISEIFDGQAPHAPRGCFAQAWSVAEVLRVLAELQD